MHSSPPPHPLVHYNTHRTQPSTSRRNPWMIVYLHLVTEPLPTHYPQRMVIVRLRRNLRNPSLPLSPLTLKLVPICTFPQSCIVVTLELSNRGLLYTIKWLIANSKVFQSSRLKFSDSDYATGALIIQSPKNEFTCS
uniref:Uncharacterized protein n=1 Tax=Cacopsylla melanoneura TaxID=428564 RepID=A0A8D8R2C2_9HEMI